MSTIRGVKDRRFKFVQLLNSMFEDQNLSLKAKGFIGYCLTKPSDWKFHIQHLCSVLKEGEKAVYSVINECIEHGYAFRYQPRTEAGEFLPWETVVSDSKHEIEEIKSEIQKILPLACFGDADNRVAEKDPPSNTNNIPIQDKKNNDDDDARETADLKSIVEQEKSIPEVITYKSASGVEKSVSKNEIFRRFTKHPFKTQTLVDAIKRLIERKDLIGDVFRYLETICSQIESNDRPIAKPERKQKQIAADSIPMPKEGQEFAPGCGEGGWYRIQEQMKKNKNTQNQN